MNMMILYVLLSIIAGFLCFIGCVLLLYKIIKRRSLAIISSCLLILLIDFAYCYITDIPDVVFTHCLIPFWASFFVVTPVNSFIEFFKGNKEQTGNKSLGKWESLLALIFYVSCFVGVYIAMQLGLKTSEAFHYFIFIPVNTVFFINIGGLLIDKVKSKIKRKNHAL